MAGGIQPISILDEFYRYNHWANWKVLELCDGLRDTQLDEPKDLGFGTLRNTLFHILAAEEVWWERWNQIPPRPFPLDAGSLSVVEISRRLDDINTRRSDWLDEIGDSGLATLCSYQDSKGTAYSNPLKELLVHVANHGVHHRAQALRYLKGFGRTRRGGIDHLFFRFANPSISQPIESVAAMRQYGLECLTGVSPQIVWDKPLIERFFAYGDWATEKLMLLADQLSDSHLDHDFQMGPGSIRKTLLHLFDAENFWVSNWTTGESHFSFVPLTTSIDELKGSRVEMVQTRNRFVAEQDSHSVSRILKASFGGPEFLVPTIESMTQVCMHGTHHRAQLCNMLRHSGIKLPATDYVVWAREENRV